MLPWTGLHQIWHRYRSRHPNHLWHILAIAWGASYILCKTYTFKNPPTCVLSLTDLLAGVDSLVLSSHGISGCCFVRVLNESVSAVRRHSDHLAVALEDRPYVVLAQQYRVQVADEYSGPNRQRVRVVRHVTYLAHHYVQHTSRASMHPQQNITQHKINPKN